MDKNPGETKNRDSRLFERMPCSFQVELAQSVDQRSEKGVAMDFSGSGFGIKTAKNIPVGDFVEITIHHPGASEPILQKAHVVWAKKDESGEWRLGFEFPTYNLTRFIPLMSSRREGGR